MPGFHKYSIIILLATLFGISGSGQTFKEYFNDSSDSAFDVSNFLNTRVGFMPVPFLITEPATGYGLGLGLIYFHRTKQEKESGKYHYIPPSLSMAGGLYTENGTWAVMLAHQGSYKKDHIRYLGALGYVNANLDFYGAGILVEERAYRFNINGFLLFQELLFRIKDSPVFLGANYMYFLNDITFDLSEKYPQLKPLTQRTSTAGLNAVVLYDTRNTIFTPDKGIMTALELGFHSPFLGGTSEYGSSNFRFYGFTNKILKKTVAGFRINSQYKWGDVPFYELPFINLRGIPAMRYQDHAVNVFETEWRWNIWRRWSILGFAGAGFTGDDPLIFDIDVAKVAYGTGFRYYIAKVYGMHAGVDFAWGPENFAWYITIGSAWFR